MSYYNEIKLDPILNAENRIKIYVSKFDNRQLTKSFDYFFCKVLEEVSNNNEEEYFSRDFLAYLLNLYFCNLDTKYPKSLLDRVENCITQNSYIDQLLTQYGYSKFSSCFEATIEGIEFIKENIKPYANICDACFITGSMNYGRFYSVRGFDHKLPSDIDILLVSKNIFHLKDLLDHKFETNKAHLDECDKLLKQGKVDIVNFRARHTEFNLSVSYTIFSINSLKKTLSLNGSSVFIKLFRPGLKQENQNFLTDTTGDTYLEPRLEYNLRGGHVLQLESYTHKNSILRYSGFANLFLPTQFCIFSNEMVSNLIYEFNDSIIRIVKENTKNTDKENSIFLAHPRKERFSNLWTKAVISKLQS